MKPLRNFKKYLEVTELVTLENKTKTNIFFEYWKEELIKAWFS